MQCKHWQTNPKVHKLLQNQENGKVLFAYFKILCRALQSFSPIAISCGNVDGVEVAGIILCLAALLAVCLHSTVGEFILGLQIYLFFEEATVKELFKPKKKEECEAIAAPSLHLKQIVLSYKWKEYRLRKMKQCNQLYLFCQCSIRFAVL